METKKISVFQEKIMNTRAYSAQDEIVAAANLVEIIHEANGSADLPMDVEVPGIMTRACWLSMSETDKMVGGVTSAMFLDFMAVMNQMLAENAILEFANDQAIDIMNSGISALTSSRDELQAIMDEEK